MIRQSEMTPTDLNRALLLQVEDGLGYLIPPSGALGCGDAVALVVHQAADLGEVAVPLDQPVQHRGLAEEGVVAAEHPLHALLVGGDKYRGLLALHVPGVRG